MFDESHLKVTSAYIVLSLLVSAAIILICIIIHLMVKAKQVTKKIPVIITVIGIVSFLIAILLIIFVVIQVILIDGHEVHPDSNPLHHFYSSSFKQIQYMIVICDSFGHLAMLTVFVLRLQIAFENSIFSYSSTLTRYTYICLFLLSFMSILIISIDIIRDDGVYVIIVCEIVWEILIEIMCIWLLYLFISRLYNLLKITLKSSFSSNSISNSKQPKSELSLFDGITLSSSAYNMSNIEKKKKEEKVDDDKDVDVELEVSVYSIPSIPCKSKPCVDAPKLSLNKVVMDDPAVIELVHVMNKMTLLVVVCVMSSILSVIGNVFIEVHELQTIGKHTIDTCTAAIWDFLLPAFDTVITSFMMYLQFNFSGRVYSTLCGKLDGIFLNICIQINKYWLHKKKHQKQTENQTQN